MISSSSKSKIKITSSQSTLTIAEPSQSECRCSNPSSRTVSASSVQCECPDENIESVEKVPQDYCNCECDCDNLGYQPSIPPVLKNIMNFLSFKKNRQPDLCYVIDVIESLKDDVIKLSSYNNGSGRINELLRNMMCKLSQLEYNAKNNDLLGDKGDLLKKKKQIINLTQNTKRKLCKQLCAEMQRLKIRHRELNHMLQNIRTIDCDIKQLKNERVCSPKSNKNYDLTGMKITYTKTKMNATENDGKFVLYSGSKNDCNIRLEKGGQSITNDNCSEETKEKIKQMSKFWYEQAQQLINTLTP